MVISQLPVEHLPPMTLNWWDKAQHALSFFILGMLGLAIYPKNWAQLAFGLLCYGALMEMLQSLIGWRHGEFLDWVADIFGVLSALIVYFFYHRFSKKRNFL